MCVSNMTCEICSHFFLKCRFLNNLSAKEAENIYTPGNRTEEKCCGMEVDVSPGLCGKALSPRQCYWDVVQH